MHLKLIEKIKSFLISHMGKTLQDANDEELYRALVHAIRDEIMVAHQVSEKSFAKHNVRRLYYLSMEYLPGRFLTNTLHNLKSMDLVKDVLARLNRSFPNIIAKENEPGLGSGGLGRLASCLLDSLATLKLPAMGYGLRYQYGIFEQQIKDGMQIEAPDCWLINENPWETRQEHYKKTVEFGGRCQKMMNFHGDEVQKIQDAEEVWAMPYDIPILGYAGTSCLTLRLWSTKESPRNFQLQRYNAGKIDQAAENMVISDVLYPNELNETGKRIRLKQEFLLVAASLQDIISRYLESHDTFHDFADKIRIQINDTHPALVIAELTRILNKERNIPWKQAVEMTQAVTSYTNHTILREALEEWDVPLMRQLLPRQYGVIEKLNYDFCEHLRSNFAKDEERIRRLSIIENGRVRMANLSIFGSHKVNGVSQIHTEILKNDVFKDFYELWPDRFVNVTNGVTQRLWLLQCNPALSAFISKRIGDAWITDFSKIAALEKFADCSEAHKEFWEIRTKNKASLISFLKRSTKIKDASGKRASQGFFVDPDFLFDVQIKRFHEYKRQLMNALHLIMLYHDVLEDPNSRVKRCCIFAGKTSAGYEIAKDIMRLIFAIMKKVNKDPVARRILQVAFVENYSVAKAQVIIPAADISEQISTAGTEASGTSVMKFAMNGALTVATHDGANIEINEAVSDAWWPFGFGLVAGELKEAPEKNHSNEKINKALNALKDRSLAANDSEHAAFCRLYDKLNNEDRYFVLRDLERFYQVQKKVEEHFQDKTTWAKYAIHTMSRMGRFSTDSCIQNYCNLIWGLKPCPADPAIMDEVRALIN